MRNMCHGVGVQLRLPIYCFRGPGGISRYEMEMSSSRYRTSWKERRSKEYAISPYLSISEEFQDIQIHELSDRLQVPNTIPRASLAPYGKAWEECIATLMWTAKSICISILGSKALYNVVTFQSVERMLKIEFISGAITSIVTIDHLTSFLWA